MSTIAPAGLAAILVAATLPRGGSWFGAAVVVWAAAVLVGMAQLMGRAGPRPLLPASAVAALGVPVTLTLGAAASWQHVPTIAAAAVLTAFGLALITRPSQAVTVTLGATLLPALVIGLGAGGVLVLRSAQGGFRWTLALLLLTVVPHASGAVADRRAPNAGVAVRVIAVGATAGALLMAGNPPLGPMVVIVLTVVGLGMSWTATELTAALAPPSRRRSETEVFAALVSPLLAAPIASFLAQGLQV